MRDAVSAAGRKFHLFAEGLAAAFLLASVYAHFVSGFWVTADAGRTVSFASAYFVLWLVLPVTCFPALRHLLANRHPALPLAVAAAGPLFRLWLAWEPDPRGLREFFSMFERACTGIGLLCACLPFAAAEESSTKALLSRALKAVPMVFGLGFGLLLLPFLGYISEYDPRFLMTLAGALGFAGLLALGLAQGMRPVRIPVLEASSSRFESAGFYLVLPVVFVGTLLLYRLVPQELVYGGFTTARDLAFWKPFGICMAAAALGAMILRFRDGSAAELYAGSLILTLTAVLPAEFAGRFLPAATGFGLGFLLAGAARYRTRPLFVWCWGVGLLVYLWYGGSGRLPVFGGKFDHVWTVALVQMGAIVSVIGLAEKSPAAKGWLNRISGRDTAHGK